MTSIFSSNILKEGPKMARYRNVANKISGGPAYDLILAVERYVYNYPSSSNESIHHQDIDLTSIAIQSISISENTALHKVLHELAYIEFYLYLYDDIDWVDNIFDFAEYATSMFPEMNLETPIEFLSKQESDIYYAKKKYDQYFIHGLNHLVNSAFAVLWHRKSFLLDFNLKIAEKIRPLKKCDFPMLEQDGRVPRTTYFKKWIQNAIQLRERGNCHYCGRVVASPAIANQEYDIDHMVPIAQGGTNDPTNLVLSCPSCNNDKRASIRSFDDVFNWPKIN
ncbi:HNH endonuclease [Vogesella indigofera]|uniref:HNH endonuclease n=1 Tax=Vogesella indigofera TaxID=45465 RepID=UPI00234F82BF|nr:HNH endonuclease signature motif containing protein [Vogesella indigofera]MDC7701412.1 HNH endonuclease signature motif containing protein [Vogesella indigofera]